MQHKKFQIIHNALSGHPILTFPASSPITTTHNLYASVEVLFNFTYVMHASSSHLSDAAKPYPLVMAEMLFNFIVKVALLSRSMLIRSLLCLCLLSCISEKAYADAFGITGSVEIVKLSQIIAQMTQLLSKTENLIELQEAVEDYQATSLFRKIHGHSSQLVRIFELAGVDLGESGNRIIRLIDISDSFRQLAARVEDYESQEGLYLMADSLRLLINAAILIEETAEVLQQTSSSPEFNSQDQLLAGMHHTLSEINSANTQAQFDENMNRLHQHNILHGSFNVFSDR